MPYRDRVHTTLNGHEKQPDLLYRLTHGHARMHEPVAVSPAKNRRSIESDFASPSKPASKRPAQPRRRLSRRESHPYRERRRREHARAASEPVIERQAAKPTMGDRLHGMAKKLAGSLKREPEKKAEGDAMMEGGRTRVRPSRQHREKHGV